MIVSMKLVVELLAGYFQYYHGARTHLALEKDSPEPRPIQPPEMGRVVGVPQVGGLHHATNEEPPEPPETRAPCRRFRSCYLCRTALNCSL